MKRFTKGFDVRFDSKAMDDKNDGGKFLTFQGFASTFDRDFTGDIIERGAFVESIQRSRDKAQNLGRKALIPALFNHNSDEPIGRFVELRETEDGLFAKGELHRASKTVSEKVIPAMESEAIMSMSIGFFIDQKRFEGDTRIIEKLTLVETSLVTFPANEGARVTDFKDRSLTSKDLEDMDVRDIEHHFLKGNPVSRSIAVKITSLLKANQRDADTAFQRDAGVSDVDNLALNKSQMEIYHSLKRFTHARA